VLAAEDSVGRGGRRRVDDVTQHGGSTARVAAAPTPTAHCNGPLAAARHVRAGARLTGTDVRLDRLHRLDRRLEARALAPLSPAAQRTYTVGQKRKLLIFSEYVNKTEKT